MTEPAAFLQFAPVVANLWQSYQESNLAGKGIVVAQIVLSVVVWSLMIGKGKELRDIRLGIESFRRLFKASGSVLGLFFRRRESGLHIDVIYREACGRLVAELSGGDPSALPDERAAAGRTLRPASIALVKSVLEETLAEQQIRLDNMMTFIAIGASSAPLIGLLGTVLGVLDAFQQMGAKGSALLSEVAPGISSALLTTVLGLLIAIPSAAGYNLLVSKIHALSIKLDSFADEYLARLSLEFGTRGYN